MVMSFIKQELLNHGFIIKKNKQSMVIKEKEDIKTDDEEWIWNGWNDDEYGDGAKDDGRDCGPVELDGMS